MCLYCYYSCCYCCYWYDVVAILQKQLYCSSLVYISLFCFCQVNHEQRGQPNWFIVSVVWRRVGTWVALLSEEFFSPEDRLSLLALCALSEVSDEGVVLPEDCNTSTCQERSTFLHLRTEQSILYNTDSRKVGTLLMFFLGGGIRVVCDVL